MTAVPVDLTDLDGLCQRQPVPPGGNAGEGGQGGGGGVGGVVCQAQQQL